MTRHIHIVPSIPPAFNGLGDYCYHLWRSWPEPKPEWHLAVVDVPSGAQEAWPESVVHSFELSAEGLLKTLNEAGAEKTILHYVGYGYARRGAPLWLPKALAEWKSTSGGKLVVMFHELYATGPVWKSEFWFCLAQMKVARSLAELADWWITSCPHYVKVLTTRLGADPIRGQMIPVGSNIEAVREPDWDAPWPPSIGEKLRVAVFGNPLTRLRALRKHQGLLRHLAESGDLGEVKLIGRSDSGGQFQTRSDQILATIKPACIVSHHLDLPGGGVSEAMLDCHLGLVENAYGILYKSTAHAAYVVHGLLPIIPASKDAGPGFFWQNEDSINAQTCFTLESCYRDRAQAGVDFGMKAMTREFAAACEATT